VVISLPTGWSAVNASDLTKSGLKLAPGASVNMAVSVRPGLTGAGTGQGVSFCVSDATACSYHLAGTSPTLTLPLKFAFTHSPAPTGTPSTSLCPTEVQLTDGFATSPANVPIQNISVTLAAAANSIDPSLDFTSVTPPLTDGTGAAAFDCTPPPAVGGPYKVVAVGQYASTSIPSADSGAFIVYSHLNPCGGDCTGAENGNGGTHLDVNSDALGDLGTSFFDAGNGQYPTFGCDGVKKLEGRPDVLQATSDGDKTVVITWSKAVTLKFTDNGTPHWQVCMAAPAVFTTDANTDAVINDAGLYEGTIPLCGAAFLSPDKPNPCMAISRNAAQEIATITLPSGWANGDPYFH
jgi:hypothetical protein